MLLKRKKKRNENRKKKHIVGEGVCEGGCVCVRCGGEGLYGIHNNDCNDDVVDDEVVSMATATPSSAFELKFDFGGGIVGW